MCNRDSGVKMGVSRPVIRRSFIKNERVEGCAFGLYTPFIGVVSWAAIIAVSVYPMHTKLSRTLGGKEKWSAVIIVLIGLSILLVPTWSLTGSSIDTA